MQNQNTFQVEEWTEAHQEGLSIPDRVNLIRMEDVKAAKLVKYIEPQSSGVEPVVTLPMKRYFAAGGFTTFCIVVIAAAEQGAFAAAASIGGYIVFIGGGVGIAFALIRSCFVWTHGGASSDGNGQSKSGGNNYYQYNNFGEQPNQNNGTK